MLKTKLQDLFNVSFKLCENLLVLLVYSFYWAFCYFSFFCFCYVMLLQLEKQILQAGGTIPQVDIN